jgi:hypothetical protein
MNVLGVLLLMSSVALFIYSLPWYNVDQTFTTFVPFCTLLLASASTVAYGVKCLRQLYTCRDEPKKNTDQ